MEITFEKFGEKALEKSYGWLCDEEIRRLVMSPPVSREGQQKWFRELEGRQDYWIESVCREGMPIGVVGLKHISYADKSAEYFGYIGEKTLWGNEIGKQMMKHALERAKQLGMHTVWLKVAQGNERAKRLYLRFGFSECSEVKGVLEMRKMI